MRKRIKQLSIVMTLIFGTIIFMMMGGHLYLNSVHGQKLIQATINKNIPGSITWEYGRLSFLKGEIEVKNTVIQGPDNDDIAGFDRFFIKIAWYSLFKGCLTVESLLLEKPWTKISIDKTGGLNLVQTFVTDTPEDQILSEGVAEKRALQLPRNIIVKNFTLSHGSLHIETVDKNMEIMLQEISLVAQADMFKQSGKLALHVKQGKINSPKIHTEVDGCTIEATISNGRIDPLIAQISSPSANLKLSGTVTDIVNRPSISAILDCTASLNEICQSLNLESILTGQAVAKLNITGPLENPDAILHFDYGGGIIFKNIVDSITFDLQLNNRLAAINNLRIKAAEGTLNGQGSMDLKQAFQKGFLSTERNLQAVTYDISLEEKGVRLDKLQRDSPHWKGVVNSSLSLRSMGFSSQNINAKASLTIDGQKISTQKLVAPVNFKANCKLEMNREIVEVKKLNVQADRSEFNAVGSFNIPSRSINGKLSLIAPDLSKTLSPFGFNDIHGTIGLNAAISGTTEHPLFVLDLEGEKLRFQDITLGSIRLKADLNSLGILKISQCMVNNETSALQITGIAHIYDKIAIKPLRDTVFTLDINGDTIHLGDFIKNIKGNVSLTSHFEGTIIHPSGIIKLNGSDFDLYGQKIDKINLISTVDSTKIRLNSFQIFITPTESIRSAGWISFKKEYNLSLVSRGISLQNIEKVQTQDIADGIVLIDISGHGTFANPILTGELSINNFRIKGKERENFHITMDIHDHIARLKGKLNFDLDGLFDLKKKDFSLVAFFNETDLSPYWKIAGNPDFSGKLTGKIEAKGNLQSIDTITADLKISEFDLLYKEIEILRSWDFTASLKNKTFTIPESTLIMPHDGRITISGKGILGSSGAFRVDGAIPLTLVGQFVEELSDIKGIISISSKFDGIFSHPDINADLELQNVSCTIPFLLQKLHTLNGKIRINGKTVVMDGIDGYIDTGSFNLAGSIILKKNFQPESMSMTLKSSTLPINIPDTLDLLLNSKLQIRGTKEETIVNGEIIILEGTYYKDVNLSLFKGIGWKKREITPIGEEITFPFLKNMNFDILIKQRNPFLIDNDFATLNVNPDLSIVGTINNPVISGRATVTSGTVRYQGKSFVVKKGVIDFANPYKTDPLFDIQSEIKVRGWMIFLEITGTQDQLNFKLTSDPPEEHGDILSLLLLGKTTGELIVRETGPTQSTEQMLAGLIASTLGKDIKEATGLDIFEVETSPENNKAVSDRIKLILGKELSKRTTIKYSVESKEGEIFQRAVAEYKLLEHFLARGFQNTLGVYGGELQFRLEFR